MEQTICSRTASKGLVGERICVFWADDATWFSGSIREYNAATETHLVVYDDGDQRHEELHDPTLQWELIAASAAPLPTRKAASVAARGTASAHTNSEQAIQGRRAVRMTAAGGKQAKQVELTDAAQAALRQAEVEGLTIHPAVRYDSTTGYRNVRKYRHGQRCYEARVCRAGKKVYLGIFATAEEAALAFARTPEAQAEVANAKPAPPADNEFVAQAATEGLKLEPSSHASGYKGVILLGGRYRAQVWRVGKNVVLGCFATAEEAALAVARANARTDAPAASPRPAAAKRAAPPPKLPLAKQLRSSLAPRCLQPVALQNHAASTSIALGTVAAAAPAPALFKDKLALLKRELGIEPATPAIPAIAEANALMGITPSSGDSLLAQLDNVIAAIS